MLGCAHRAVPWRNEANLLMSANSQNPDSLRKGLSFSTSNFKKIMGISNLWQEGVCTSDRVKSSQLLLFTKWQQVHLCASLTLSKSLSSSFLFEKDKTHCEWRPSTNCTHFVVQVDHSSRTLRCAVELHNIRYFESLLECLPDVGSQAIASCCSHLVLVLINMLKPKRKSKLH